LPLRERKQRGHFSTPSQLVERILDACGYSPENDLSRLRVLDPACGSGNFLVGAARRLAAFATRSGLSHDELAALAAHNLWGFDPDPVSCFLAEMNVGAYIPERLHIHQADGLALPWDGYEGVDLFLANPPYLAAKNTDLSGYRSTHRSGQLDSYLLFLDLALSVVRPGGWLGLVLPDPVLARANASRQRARLLETSTVHHLWHLSDVFAASVGAVVIIAQKCPVPATHLISWERASWSHGSRQQAEPDGQSGQREQHREAHSTVPQSLFQRQPGAELRYLLSSGRGALVERLHAHLEHANGSERRLAPLSDFLTIRRGEELGRKSSQLVQRLPPPTVPDHPLPGHPTPGHPQGVALLYTTGSLCERAADEGDDGGVYSRATPCGWPGEQGGSDGSGVDGIDDNCPGTQWYPVLLGGVDVKPYGMPVGSCWMARETIEKPVERYLAPKLLVVKSTERLQAALDMNGHVVLQTLYLLHARTEAGVNVDDLYFFLALLNSRLLREYVYILHTAYKWVQPQIEQHVLARLPVPLTAMQEKGEIIERAKRLMGLMQVIHVCSEVEAVVELKQQWQSLYEEQERAVYALYTSALPRIYC
jgi:SAM-dependent methyltransferase